MADNELLLAGTRAPERTPRPVFAPETVDFLSALSGALRADSALGRDEEGAALAFWLRRAHLEELSRRHGGGRRLGRGLLFHVPPANVPLLFAYSLAVGLLSGNANRLRLSARRDGRADAFCRVLDELLARPQWAELRPRISLIAYPREDGARTAAYLADCDGRVIWGGDATVAALRALPARPGAVELCFPDRWSLCLLSEAHVAGLDEEGLALLAHRFYNDTYAMDQNACSSPRLVLWLADGDGSVHGAFWDAVLEQAARRYELTAYKAARKYEAACLLAMTEPAVERVERMGGNLLTRIALSRPPADMDPLRLGFGAFLEYRLECLEGLVPFVTPRTQTLTLAGPDRDALAGFAAERRLRGIDRVVQVGQAMEFDTIWDGKDLIAQLSRVIC